VVYCVRFSIEFLMKLILLNYWVGSDKERVLLGLIRMYFQLQRLMHYQVGHTNTSNFQVQGLNMLVCQLFIQVFYQNVLSFKAAIF
jgi:hypothetical protein